MTVFRTHVPASRMGHGNFANLHVLYSNEESLPIVSRSDNLQLHSKKKVHCSLASGTLI